MASSVLLANNCSHRCQAVDASDKRWKTAVPRPPSGDGGYVRDNRSHRCQAVDASDKP